ncbi:hypothetical protein [Sediminibacillus albus]|nr:hypothetical protein [Sediminibacillus albus]
MLLSIRKNLHVFNWSRQLRDYERKQLGTEWKIETRLAGITNLVLGMLFFWQWSSIRIDSTYHADADFLTFYMLPLLAVLLVAANVGLVLRARKVDKSSQGTWKSYAGRNFFARIIFGILLAVFILFLALSAVVLFI